MIINKHTKTILDEIILTEDERKFLQELTDALKIYLGDFYKEAVATQLGYLVDDGKVINYDED